MDEDDGISLADIFKYIFKGKLVGLIVGIFLFLISFIVLKFVVNQKELYIQQLLTYQVSQILIVALI